MVTETAEVEGQDYVDHKRCEMVRKVAYVVGCSETHLQWKHNKDLDRTVDSHNKVFPSS